MPVQVLVPVNESKASLYCREIAARMTKTLSAEVTLFHATDTHSVQFKNIPPLQVDIIREKAMETAQAYLVRQAKAMSEQSIIPRTVLVEGEAAESVCKEAHRGYDFIMMGAVPHSDLRYMFLGSVVSALINSCNRPVLVVKPTGPALEDLADGRRLRVMLAADASPASARCIEFFTGLGAAGALEITLVHVNVAGNTNAEPVDQMLGRYSRMLELAGCSVETATTQGTPGKAIAAMYEEGDYDFIVAGKATSTEMGERIGYSVGHYLFHNCNAHQMIIP